MPRKLKEKKWNESWRCKIFSAVLRKKKCLTVFEIFKKSFFQRCSARASFTVLICLKRCAPLLISKTTTFFPFFIGNRVPFKVSPGNVLTTQIRIFGGISILFFGLRTWN